jgi:hypothetical protein
MTHIALLLGIILTACSLSAQPVLVAANHSPAEGDTLLVELLVSSNYAPHPTGPNQVFDYTNLGWGTSMLQDVFAADSLNPNALSIALPFSNNLWHEAYIVTADSLSLSDATFYSPTGEVDHYDDPALQIPFPFQYGDIAVDVYQGERWDGPNVIPFEGNVTIEADAYGTLLLGFDAISNVLAVHTVDSMRLGPSGNTTLIVKQCYEYYSALHKFPMMSACRRTGDQNYYIATNNYYPLSVVGVSDRAAADLGVYPLPFERDLSFRAPASGRASLRDLFGAVMYEANVNPGEVHWELQDLPGGIYVLVVEGSKGRWTQSLVHH